MPDPTRNRTNVESAARGPTIRNHKNGLSLWWLVMLLLWIVVRQWILS
jgi:hypothetical protein